VQKGEGFLRPKRGGDSAVQKLADQEDGGKHFTGEVTIDALALKKGANTVPLRARMGRGDPCMPERKSETVIEGKHFLWEKGR